MRKLLTFMTSLVFVAVVIILVAILVTCIGINHHNWNAAEQAIQTNVTCILDETSEESYELLLNNDWEGFKDFYGLKPTYYTVGDACYVSLVSDQMEETIMIYAGTVKNPRVSAIAVQGYGEHWEGFDMSEPYSVLVTISGHPIYLTATGAASLCYNLTRVTSK